MLVFVTPNNLYIFSPKDMSLATKCDLKLLQKLLIITTSTSLLALKMSAGPDLFIESIRRNEFIVFLLANAENQGFAVPRVKNS